jgi:hypothetical protein
VAFQSRGDPLFGEAESLFPGAVVLDVENETLCRVHVVGRIGS